MDVAVGADHAGFALKEKVKKELEGLGHRVHDLGTVSDESVDYPDFAARVAREVAGGRAEAGVLVCGSGVGMSIAANKVHGVRAANVHTIEEAKLSREHNNANVLALGARTLEEKSALEILRTWFTTGFSGGRHQRRVDKIMELERNSE